MGMARMVARRGLIQSGEKARSGAAYRRRNGESGAQGAARTSSRRPCEVVAARDYSRCTARPRPSDHSSALDCCVSYSASTYCTRML